MSASTSTPRTDPPAPPPAVAAPGSNEDAPQLEVVERGSFAHARCTACGWRGPGRRARSVCVEDGSLHALAGCGV